MSYDETNRGALWGNRKKKTEKHPDFTGKINVNGVDYELVGWKRGPDANPKAPALSLKVSEKREDAAETETNTDTDNDIPF